MTAKKNSLPDYTSSTHENWLASFIARNEWAIILNVLSVGVLLVSLFIASKLAPLQQTDSVIITRVDAIEELLTHLAPTSDLQNMEKRLDRMENKIDRILDYQSNP